ncbi:zinc finger protein, putative [Talaromyces stipitatus ATCC 10500]|uniref:Zinc finger protein, putative n=1 Tax=Talaromyces stipitatus (strain ATCC 10500 / CBS 375.48 / QM 6759 / NRRL 1006) TaxID=441959 RepID=B8LSU3_TALSN|nr:zinc finger protein, putative [Talaromyces stipitatus ATCC 10500]EED22939.1 zinc finger protein, putative [Talaromyces stipitatus ATCC 10500]
MVNRPLTRDNFHVAIVCALPLETNAVLCSLDEIWHDAPQYYKKSEGDHNAYHFGRSGSHNVVVVTLPGEGKVNAAGAAQSLKMSFNSIKLALLVGICGAVPFKKDRTEIILGDVVISEVIVDLDHGRQYAGGFWRKDTLLDVYARPNEEILGLLRTWKTAVILERLRQGTKDHLTTLLNNPHLDAWYPGVSEDKLFRSEYEHKHHTNCLTCYNGAACDNARTASCTSLSCDKKALVPRQRLGESFISEFESPTPFIHFGSIGTGDSVMKSARHRDNFADTENVIAFEMEGAGIWDKFSCLIIKGVCDYADSHKNKRWQAYAAAVAASVMKVVLEYYVTPRRESGAEISNGTHSPQALFDNKVKSFERRFNKEQWDAFKVSSAGSLKRLLKKVQDEQKASRSIQNMRRMEYFLKAAESLDKLMEEVLIMPGFICYIWGPAKLLLQRAKDHPDRLEAYLTAYERIGANLPTFETSRNTFKENMGLQSLLAEVFDNVLDFHHRMTKLYCGRALKESFKSLWKDFNHRFEHILYQLGSHKVLIEDETRIPVCSFRDMAGSSKLILDHIRRMRTDAFEFDRKERERQNKIHDEVLGWFSYSRNHSESDKDESEHGRYCDDRKQYSNTGDWILSHEKVQKWLSPDVHHSSHSMLWINGRPGTGKTYLASIMIQACIEDNTRATAYFYCSENMERRATAIAVLRGILFQLELHDPELAPYCHEKMKTSDSTILSSLQRAREILGVFCERSPKLYIIIDAVDECESGEQAKNLLNIFKDLTQKCDNHSPGKLRVLFFSQPTSEIRNALSSADTLTLTPELTVNDIRKYCQHRTRELEKFEFGNEDIKNVVEIICTRADGMFLFAKLVMNNLAKQPNLASFRNEIISTRLPNEIDQAYGRIMERLRRELGEGQFEYTKLLLGWLVCSKRPLKWTEVQSASSVDLDVWDGFNELNMDFELRDNVHKLCGSLVQVFKGDRVELVHSTARRFIIEKSGIDIPAAECDLTLRCLRYLTLNVFKPDLRDEDLKLYALSGDFAFQDYAVSTWFMHIKTMVDTNLGLMIRDRSSDFEAQLKRIYHGLGHFVQFYEESFQDKSIQQQAYQDCEVFQQFNFHADLVRIWEHIRSEQSKDLVARNNVSIDLLKRALTRNRELLERLSTSEEVDVSKKYGDCIFRCPKVLCFFFHEGFKTAQARDNHVNRHERPFHCTVENCTTEGLGLASESALRKHLRTFHPEQCDLSESFTRLTRRSTSQARWKCHFCSKSFVRNLILQDHLLTHEGKKPWACSECGRPFTRKYDMTRHEKVHERRR